MKWLLIVTFPSMVVWVFGIPIMAFIMLFNSRSDILIQVKDPNWNQDRVKRVFVIDVKKKYGFLFNGY